MQINPVSFRSIHIFSPDDGKPKLPETEFLKAAFKKNPELMGYKLEDQTDNPEIRTGKDGTVFNAFRNHCIYLDKHFKNDLKQEPNKVIMTKSSFYINPRDQEERYFLTAANDNDEIKITNALCHDENYIAQRFTKMC